MCSSDLNPPHALNSYSAQLVQKGRQPEREEKVIGGISKQGLPKKGGGCQIVRAFHMGQFKGAAGKETGENLFDPKIFRESPRNGGKPWP